MVFWGVFKAEAYVSARTIAGTRSLKPISRKDSVLKFRMNKKRFRLSVGKRRPRVHNSRRTCEPNSAQVQSHEILLLNNACTRLDSENADFA